uniref:Capsid protein n=1 Tax=Cressdnaviricota sp. TaxID=2748378 RepID=A0A4D6IZS8_9VIRU|nr:capsid protein [Cressdnaviricota sp.]
MKFRFQSFVDVSTSAASMQVIQWSVGGKSVLDRCRHLFPAYKYFKLGKISVKMVPASTLPVDPQGLSYASDDPQTVDPRDQMNPGLVRITNGEDVFTDVSKLSADQQMKVYTAMMLDPRWSKFMLQSGFRRTAFPLYWQVGQLHQDLYPGATVNVPWLNDSPNTVDIYNQYGHTHKVNQIVQNGNLTDVVQVGSSPRGLFQTGHRGRLGFLPTDAFQEYFRADKKVVGSAVFNNIPEVQVLTCVLPKAYKTLYYYRVYITEEVIFSGLRSVPPTYPDDTGAFDVQVFGIDQFLTSAPQPILPTGDIRAPTSNRQQNNGAEMP